MKGEYVRKAKINEPKLINLLQRKYKALGTTDCLVNSIK